MLEVVEGWISFGVLSLMEGWVSFGVLEVVTVWVSFGMLEVLGRWASASESAERLRLSSDSIVSGSSGGPGQFYDKVSCALESSLKRRRGSIFHLVCRAIRCHLPSRSLSKASSLRITNHHLFEGVVGLVLNLRLKIKWSTVIPVRDLIALETALAVVLLKVPHTFLEPAISTLSLLWNLLWAGEGPEALGRAGFWGVPPVCLSYE